ncbi:DUF423 domain-containing protein [Spiribacter sp. 2438]|uniref:DUF423 domain-containing protein n=1 Tax=Spiribacter sp. 2438 TaxID=2666185 RepID=UPI001E35FBCD|nr:DUF423 domain-containing protein [Spiribacter sp. 2438]
MPVLLMLAAALGLLSVAFGAISEHAFRPNVDPEYFRYLMTAVRYNQVHAVALLALALGLAAPLAVETARRLRAAAWVMFVGTVLFSISIYLAVALDAMAITYVTPVGGTLLMVSWAMLIRAGWKAR